MMIFMDCSKLTSWPGAEVPSSHPRDAVVVVSARTMNADPRALCWPIDELESAGTLVGMRMFSLHPLSHPRIEAFYYRGLP